MTQARSVPAPFVPFPCVQAGRTNARCHQARELLPTRNLLRMEDRRPPAV